MSEIDFEVVSDSAWDNIPAPQKAKSVSAWEPVVEQLEAGKIVRIPVADEKQLRGKRIGLARVASSHGFKVVFRVHEGALYARKSDEPYQSERGGETIARGRKAKKEQ